MLTTSLLRSLPLFGLGLVLLAGCGDPVATTNKVSGKVTLPAGLKLVKTGDSKDSIMLTFMPTDGDKGGGGGNVNLDDLTFGPVSVGPGKYKIVAVISGYPGGADPKRVSALETLSKSFDHQNSKLEYTVTAEKEQAIVVDLAKGTVSKQ